MNVLYHSFILLLIITKTSYANQFFEEADSLRAELYLSHADSFLYSNNYDSAAFYYNKAAKEFILLEDWDKACHSKVRETYMYLDLSQYEKAIANMDEAIGIFDVALSVNNIYSFYCYIQKSNAFLQQGEYARAIQILDDAVGGFKNNPDIKTINGERWLAAAYYEYGNNYVEIGKLDSANIMFKKTLEIRERLYEKNHRLIIDCYNNLGVTYSYFEDYEMASVYMQKALKSREEKYGFANSQTAWSYTNLGILNLYMGNFEKALEYDFKGLEARKQCLPEGHVDFASSYSVIANVYNETGDHKEAQKYHNLALDIYLKKFGEDNIHVSSMYNNIADNYYKQEEFEKALSYFLKSLNILNKIFPDEKLPNHVLYESNISDTYFKLGMIDSALYYNTLALQDNYKPVQESQDIDDLLDFEFAFVSLELKADIYLYKYQQEKEITHLLTAYETYLEYIDLLDYLRNRATVIDSKLLLSHLNNTIMDRAIKTACLLNRIAPETYSEENIASLIEKNKANVLHEMLDKTDTQISYNVPDSIIEIQKEISGTIIALKSEKMLIEQEEDIHQASIIDEQIFSQQEKLSEINNQIFELSPDFEKSMTESRTGIINERLEMDVNTAILSYYISDSLLYISFTDSKQVKVKTVPIDSIFEVNTEQYIRCIKKNRINSFSTLSNDLYTILIDPIFDLIMDKQKLVIIPDKFLYYLPFETLCKDNGIDEFKSKNYLIKDYSILYHYSAGIYSKYQNNRDLPDREEVSFAGFAPVFDSDSMSVKISDDCFASLTDTNDIQDEIFRSVSFNGKTYNKLPYSKEEVCDIANLFEKKNLLADTYLYNNANETNFKNICQKYRYVHIASHGIIHENSPEVSGIIFSGISNYQSKTDTLCTNEFNSDGILLTGEMYNLNLNADLVVLSACETGLGTIVKGEGVMSMARGLMYSGTPNVLFSLWKVGDKNTYQLMIKFYDSLLNDLTYSEAIRKSKLELIAKEETAFPKFWSGFILLGAD